MNRSLVLVVFALMLLGVRGHVLADRQTLPVVQRAPSALATPLLAPADGRPNSSPSVACDGDGTLLIAAFDSATNAPRVWRYQADAVRFVVDTRFESPVPSGGRLIWPGLLGALCGPILDVSVAEWPDGTRGFAVTALPRPVLDPKN